MSAVVFGDGNPRLEAIGPVPHLSAAEQEAVRAEARSKETPAECWRRELAEAQAVVGVVSPDVWKRLAGDAAALMQER